MIEVAPTTDIDTCRTIRRRVFIEEQHVPEELEWDGLDDQAQHLLARMEGVPIGTARVLVKDDAGKIGRVCVLPEARGTGCGAALIMASLELLRGHVGITTARLGAQCHAIPFYERLGFVPFGPVYDDAGIPHRDMQRPL